MNVAMNEFTSYLFREWLVNWFEAAAAAAASAVAAAVLFIFKLRFGNDYRFTKEENKQTKKMKMKIYIIINC
ncbi:hypothetical protein DERF_010286 [Dermatophagoides farinae]|uniref:Uncharacterized protein n=1 Tax=Dermatophagoides farinae TaxID=6954 RepID=A0A922I0Z3_DERFA|nr:hypothetical protein DERF_010286 [Dermatophagoides farinae]